MFLININAIKTKTKTYLIILFSLLWILLVTVWAAEEPQGNYSDQYITATNSPIVSELAQVECNCVQWGKLYLGRENESWGIPKLIQPNSDIPWPGYLVLTNEGEFGHLGVILGIEGSNLRIIEANYAPCEISTRSLDINDSRIRGFFH